MRNIRIAELIFDTPLMIAEDKWNGILQVIGPRFDLDTTMLPKTEAREVTEGERRRAGYTVCNGVGIIGIHGPLMHRLLANDYPSGGPTTYADIRRAFDTAMEDDTVQQVVMDMDSPGGEVNGCFDLADHIYQCRGKKQITAVINEACYSAAYLLASAASKIIIPRTGGAGSVGVIATHVDQSVWNEKTGIAVTHVFAGARKADMSPHSPLSSEAMTRLQEMVTDSYQLFVSTVARNRGMSKQSVIETEAGIFSGKKAVAVGFADEVAAVDKTMARLAKHRGGTIMPGAKAEQDQGAAVEATPANEKIYSQAEFDLAVTEAKAGTEQDMAAAVAKASTDATAAERTRILAVHASCQGSDAAVMFGRLVEDGCSEQQANDRIQDALAMRSDDQQIVSRVGGKSGQAKAAIDTAGIYANLNGTEKAPGK